MSRSLPPARAARAARITLTVALWLMIVTVACVGAAARLAPLAGHEMLAIQDLLDTSLQVENLGL